MGLDRAAVDARARRVLQDAGEPGVEIPLSPHQDRGTAHVQFFRQLVRFAFSGDAHGAWRPFPLVRGFGDLKLDYFVFLGDTMYESASQGSPPAVDPFVENDFDGRCVAAMISAIPYLRFIGTIFDRVSSSAACSRSIQSRRSSSG